MDAGEIEQKYGEKFEKTMRDKKFFNRMLKSMAGISVATGSVNALILEDDRLTYVCGPYLGAAVILLASEAMNYAYDKLQNNVIELGTHSFHTENLE